MSDKLKLSKFFTVDEFEASSVALTHNIPNKMDRVQLQNATTLCTVFLGTIRAHANKPLIITSGYRGPLVNKIVGGSKTSAHSQGCAADFHIPGMTITELYEFIYKLVHDGHMPCPDQVIHENNVWIHLGIKPNTEDNRNQWLKFDGKTYFPYPIHRISI